MIPTKTVIVSAGFDDIRSQDVRFLEEAARLGRVTVLLWNDDAVKRLTGLPPKFPLAERDYVLNSIRYVDRVIPIGDVAPDSLLDIPGLRPEIWADRESPAAVEREKFCNDRNVSYRPFTAEQLSGFPDPPPIPPTRGRKKVVATGCYDWIHSGHVRFCEEASAHGDLYIVVGHDENIRLLKGDGHPLFPQEERRYAISAIKYVKQALISTGRGWLDADPEIQQLKPDIYVVNEDGDKGGKREYCQKLGIEYLVLKRTPAPGLPRRSSTELRGF